MTRARTGRWGPVSALALVLASGVRADPPLELPSAARAALEEIVTTRGYTRGLPREAMPSPDGARVFYLQSGPRDTDQRLLAYEIATARVRAAIRGEPAVEPGRFSPEEQSRRERQRETERGVTSFELSPDGSFLIVPMGGDLYEVSARDGATRALTRTPEPELDPHFAPDGAHVSFWRSGALVVQERSTGRETVVARSDSAGIEWGTAEFVAQEEMGRHTGHWWSPDGRSLALTRVDSRGVPRFRVPDFADPTGEGRTGPYPKAGDPNARVSLHLWRQGEPGSRPLDLGADVEYLARVHWAPDGASVWVETQPRSQSRVDVRRIDLRTGRAAVVLREEDRDWVRLHDDFRWLERGKRFLWTSERSGWKHLEVVDTATGARRTLTTGSWDVGRVVDVDEARRTATFTGFRAGPTEQHLYRVGWTNGRIETLSREPGWHEAAFHEHGHDLYVTTWSDERTPPRARVWRRDGRLLGELPAAAARPAALEPVRFEQLRLATADPGSPFEVEIVRPRDAPPGVRWPLVVYVYAGPGSQQVRRAWPGERGLFLAWLAARGFAVARIDGRGTGPRGRDSERIYAGRLGDAEIDDQAAGVRALLERGSDLDPERVGIWGWSYGGYATLRALARFPEIFHVGVAVAPVVDWRGYDTHYTERYLGRPQQAAAAYDSSAVLGVAARIRGRLTVVHGAGDDNVHLRESMLLVRELQRLGAQFDLMVYPGTHMMESRAERLHLYELVWRKLAEGP